jgi:uncharacterized membrane protein YhaH (DUF805 family)
MIIYHNKNNFNSPTLFVFHRQLSAQSGSVLRQVTFIAAVLFWMRLSLNHWMYVMKPTTLVCGNSNLDLYFMSTSFVACTTGNDQLLVKRWHGILLSAVLSLIARVLSTYRVPWPKEFISCYFASIYATDFVYWTLTHSSTYLRLFQYSSRYYDRLSLIFTVKNIETYRRSL